MLERTLQRGTHRARQAAVLAILLGLLVGFGAGLGAGTSQADAQGSTGTLQETDDEVTFVATSQGGFISFSEDSEQAAREGGVAFPAEGEDVPIQIRGVVNDDDTWESTEIRFPDLAVTNSLTAQVEAPTGLSGEISQEQNRMTVEGRFNVTINGESFAFDIDATTEESNELTGSSNFDTEPAAFTIVDNEFLVSDQTGGVVDRALELPAETEGENWFELPLEVDFGGDELDAFEDEQQETDTDEQGAVGDGLTLLGQGIGAVGLLGAVFSVGFFLVSRVTSARR